MSHKLYFRNAYVFLVGLIISPVIFSKYLFDTLAARQLINVYVYFFSHSYYFAKLYKLPNIIYPKGINDRVQKSKLLESEVDFVNLSDKLYLKDHVLKKLGKPLFPKTVKIFSSKKDFENYSVEQKVVLKTNNDSGGIRILQKGHTLSKDDFDLFMDAGRSNFGIITGEWAYRSISPKIFIEEYLDFEDGDVPDDYKFYCRNGSVRFCHYLCDRFDNPSEQVIDINGDDIGVPLYPLFAYGSKFTKPENWDQMLSVASKLSEGLDFVRVDLYSDRKDVYVGELTFWPQAGTYRGPGQLYYERYL